LLNGHGMSTQPAVYDAFSDVDEFDLESEQPEGDVSNPIRGILFGIAMCLPFWTAMYLLLRSI
jgi:hypothetical protein